MQFFLFLLVNAMLFIRPAEVMPWLGELQVYLACIVVCLVVSWPRVLELMRSRGHAAPPILACALGILFAILFSDVANGRMEAAFDNTIEYFKVMVYLLLLVSLVNTTERLKKFVAWIGIFSAMTSFLATVQYHGAVNLPKPPQVEGKRAKRGAFVSEKFRDPTTGKMVDVKRMCGTGLFADPNDLGLVLVTGIPICLYWLMRREGGATRLLWLGPLAVFLYALVLTHSRGSFLAMLISLGVLFLVRYGMRRSILVGAVCFPILLAGFAGRMTDFSTSEGTGQSRIHLWNDGLQMFRESPIWGVGMHQFANRARLQAHNSFVHCFAELGLLGGCLFLGAFIFAFVGMLRIARNPEWLEDARLREMFPYLMAIFVAFVVGILFLSRAYVVPTYTILGLIAAFLRLVPKRTPVETVQPQPAVVGPSPLILRPVWTLFVSSVVFLITCEAFVRVFAR